MSLTIGFLGLGLIGGSLAKGIRRIHPDYYLIAYNHNYEVVKKAYEEGCIDLALSEIDERLHTCNLIYLCMPVSYNVEYLQRIKPYLKESCILTDVGSVKGNIHHAVQNLHLEANFIGGHPMAGSEKTGYENSTDHLLENAYYALTPTEKTSEKSLLLLKELTASLGSLPIILSPEKHDLYVAAISHLPHILASGLVNFVHNADTPEQTMKALAAGGFKDITRIASASPIMWQQICLTNKNAILSILDQYLSYLSATRDMIYREDRNSLYQFFQDSKDYRDSIPSASTGPISPVYALYCDIIDKPGALATAAGLLAHHNISIKNIGITNTREFQEEALRVEFYDLTACQEAEKILKEHSYPVISI